MLFAGKGLQFGQVTLGLGTGAGRQIVESYNFV